MQILSKCQVINYGWTTVRQNVSSGHWSCPSYGFASMYEGDKSRINTTKNNIAADYLHATCCSFECGQGENNGN